MSSGSKELENSPSSPAKYNEGYIDHFQLLEAKQLRKRAEEDAKLLSNRISLLKQEETKAMKKIDEIRKRAQEITTTRSRNLEIQKKKAEERMLKEEEEKSRTMQLRIQKEQTQRYKQQTRQMMYDKIQQEALALKSVKRSQDDKIQMQKQDDFIKNATIKDHVKNSQRAAEEKKRRDAIDRRTKAKAELEKKIEEEKKFKSIREEEVTRMEKEELELINRLQNTQMLQRTAYEDLELAMAGQIDVSTLIDTKSTSKQSRSKK